MLSRPLLVVALLVQMVSAEYANCPCIKDYPTSGKVLSQMERTLQAQGSATSLGNFSLRYEKDGQNCTAYAPPGKDGDGVTCYPPEYGLGSCKAHDLGVSHRCKASPMPEFCGLDWCYIDPAHCNVHYEKSRMFPMLDLHYSYVACGDDDLFTEDRVEAQLQRRLTERSVRVTYGLQEAPYIFKGSDGRWDGVLVEFVNDLVDNLGLTLEEVPISNASLAKHGEVDPNTACANDIALGLTDLCVGNAWETTDRLRLASGLPAWWQEHLYLVTFTATKQSLMETMLQVFTPFSAGLWAFIIGAVLLYSLLMWWVEINQLHHGSTSGSLAYSLYMVLLGHLSASPMYMPKTVSGRFITVAFSFFVLIVIASYTANLASFLLQESTKGKVDSLSSALGAGMKVCSSRVLTPVLEAQHPGISQQLVYVESYEQAFEAMGGACEAMLVPKFAYDMALGGLYTPDNPSAHCDKLLVGQPVISINSIGMTSEKFLMPLSYFMVKYRSLGDLEKILRRTEYQLPSSQCAAEDVETEQLSVSSMLGTITISAALTVVGVIIKCCCNWPRLGGGSDGLPGTANAGEGADEIALEGGLASQPAAESVANDRRPRSASSLAAPEACPSGRQLRRPRPPWTAGPRTVQDPELEAVRGAMEQVLAMLSQRQSGERSLADKPLTLLEKVTAENLDAKQLLQEMQL